VRGRRKNREFQSERTILLHAIVIINIKLDIGDFSFVTDDRRKERRRGEEGKKDEQRGKRKAKSSVNSYKVRSSKKTGFKSLFTR
jgi:hypothetical protein